MTRAAAITASLVRVRDLGSRVSLTPSGAGVACLVVPGLLVAGLARHRLLVAIGIGAALVLLANLGLAAWALRRLQVELEGPDLVQVDERVVIDVELRGVDSVACEVKIGSGGHWLPASTPASGPVDTHFPARSVVETIPVFVRTSVPFNLVMLTHHHTAVLTTPIAVAPVLIATELEAAATGEPERRFAGTADASGLRRYQPGDLRRDVHWPSVARKRILLVRDRQAPDRPSLAVLRVQPDWFGNVELALGRSRAVGEQLLALGHRIRVGDSEVIVSRRELARRLASVEIDDAIKGGGAERPGEATVIVSREGARWQTSKE